MIARLSHGISVLLLGIALGCRRVAFTLFHIQLGEYFDPAFEFFCPLAVIRQTFGKHTEYRRAVQRLLCES